MHRLDLRRGREPVRILIGAMVISLLAVLVSCAAASSITAYLGEEIPLSGSGTGTDTVYLFVTGPNLPADGGSLSRPFSPVVTGEPGTFTTAEVGADTGWTVTWDTTGIGLDAGTYLVYAVDAPVSRSGLAGHAYAVTPVILIGPGSGGGVTTATTLPASPDSTTLPLRTARTAAPTPTSPAPTPMPAPVAAALLACAALGVLRVVRRR
ncbi:hypothetical protein FGU65_10215 [Methanoculleus sp. FWC-SCC1]|uniref:Uncharacterized protein n=1 Tax=Methanoculleus frigidifontis TaxID=2584085 RepID=A0ABT8MBE9_9EURY|nr:hypothetical protein [Methanoculleus sp. FWC-SCC1]MDN7025260.1 hypothetical protein [Methanoculleus sp. FWC-SCC1]